MNPRVSVVIPTYNRADVIGEAVASVLAQDLPELEVLVVDDGSADGTRAAVEAVRDPRVRYLHQENGGPAAARNHGIREAQSQLVAFLDDDDRWRPNKLSRQLAVFDARPELGMVYTDTEVFGPRQSRLRRFLFPRQSSMEVRMADGWVETDLYFSCFIVMSTVLARKDVIERAGFFDPAYRKMQVEDHDLFVKMARVAPVGYLDEPLVLRRSHPGQFMAQKRRAAEGMQAMLLTRLADAESPAALKGATDVVALNPFVNYGVAYRATPAYRASLSRVLTQAWRAALFRGVSVKALAKWARFAMATVAAAWRAPEPPATS